MYRTFQEINIKLRNNLLENTISTKIVYYILT